MDVILLERIAKLGQMGDVVKVKDGYARNFLLPKGKALRANEANRKKFESQRVELEARNLEQKKEAEAVAEKLDGKSFDFFCAGEGETCECPVGDIVWGPRYHASDKERENTFADVIATQNFIVHKGTAGFACTNEHVGGASRRDHSDNERRVVAPLR